MCIVIPTMGRFPPFHLARSVENAYCQVLFVGNSHVRRIAEVAYPFMPDCMAGVIVSFHHKGGAGVKLCWNIPAGTKYDIIVLCIGSNNIVNGMEASDLFSRLNFHARRCKDSGLCSEVIIMGHCHVLTGTTM